MNTRKTIIMITMAFTAMNQTRAQEQAMVELLTPKVRGHKVTLETETLLFEPEFGDRLLFQRATDRDFTRDLYSGETAETHFAWSGMEAGHYYVRAMIRGPNGEPQSDWSGMVGFTIHGDVQPQQWRYSLAHVPSAPGWETGLELVAPLGATARLIRQDPAGGPLTTWDLPGLASGEFHRIHLPETMVGAPILIESDGPLAVGVTYRGPAGTSTTRAVTHQDTDHMILTGLLETTNRFSALVVANHSRQPSQVTLVITVLEEETGAPVDVVEQQLTLQAGSNRVMVPAPLLPEMPGDGSWSLWVEATSTQPGLNLIGAIFTNGQGAWLNGEPIP